MNETFTPALVGTAAFCLIVLIILVVPAVFAHGRRWRESWSMRWANHSLKPSSASPATKRRVEQLGQAENVPQDPLGWSAEEAADGVAATQRASSEQNEARPGRGKTILIADDDPVVIFALARRLQQLGYTVLRSPDAIHALLGTMRARPDLVILDVNMPSGNGLAVCEMMASDPQYAGTPVIIHSVIADEATKLRAQRLGAHHVEKSPRSWVEIRSLVERLLPPADVAKEPTLSGAVPIDNAAAIMPRLERPRQNAEPVPTAAHAPTAKQPAAASTNEQHLVQPLEHKPLTILCVDDDPLVARSVALRLGPYGIVIKEADNGTAGYLRAAAEMPDLILLDLKMPNGEGNYVLSRLKDNARTKSIPTIVLTSERASSTRRQMLAMGADAFVTKPVDWLALYNEMGRCVQLPKKLLADYSLPEQLTLAQL